jgi:hypothetical protein
MFTFVHHHVQAASMRLAGSSGRKRWALYPPHITPPGVDPMAYDSLTSLQWLLEVYPALPKHLKPLEFVQEPGDLVFVPGGEEVPACEPCSARQLLYCVIFVT